MNVHELNKMLYNASMGGQEKIANLAIDLGTFVREKLREVSVIDKVLPPQYVTHSDLQREENTNTYSMIVDKEPDSTAAVVNLSGNFKPSYVTGVRVKVPFYKIESEEKTINVNELPAFTYPVTKVIEDNQVRDIQIAKDVRTFRAIDTVHGAPTVVAATAAAATANYLSTSLGGYLNKAKMVQLKNLIDKNRLATDRVIMNIIDFNDLMSLDSTELGNDLASQVFVDGYVFTTFMGMKIHVTTNSEVVPVGRVYAFAQPDFLGKQYVLQDTQFSIEKRHDVMSWKMWQVLGIGLINTNALAILDIADSATREGL